MPLISEQLPNLMNGMSEQSKTMRMSSQCELQVNGLSSLLRGVGKRPPLKHIATMANFDSLNAKMHTINRDEQEQYLVAIEDGDLSVFDAQTGASKTVSFPDGKSYLDSTTPHTDFSLVTVADTTFVVNKKVQCLMQGVRTPDNVGDAMLFVRATAFNNTYKIKLNGTAIATHTTPDGTGEGDATSIETVVEDLKTQAESNVTADFEVHASGPVVYIKEVNGNDFNISITDNAGGANVRTIYRKIQSFTDLPTYGPTGFVVEVVADTTGARSSNSYWLRFQRTGAFAGEVGAGIWEETNAPNSVYRIDPATMPHKLDRNEDGTFTFDQVPWADRTVGDGTTAPSPNFIFRRISEVYVDRDRLCLVAGRGVSMSAVGRFYDFFPSTLTTLLDGDRIDVSVSSKESAKLRHAVPFRGKIVLFSDETQFLIDSEFLVASQPPAILPITRYRIDQQVEPATSGELLYFSMSNERHSRVMEYFVTPESIAGTMEAATINKHVPSLIPNKLQEIVASNMQDMIVCWSQQEKSKLFIYKHHWQGTEKLQSSWSEWKLPDTCLIRHVSFIKNKLLLVVRDTGFDEDEEGSKHLLQMEFDPDNYDEGGLDFPVCLDRRLSNVEVSKTYDSLSDQTTLTLPYKPSRADSIRVIQCGAADAGREVPVVSSSTGSTEVVVSGDITGALFYVGEVYDFIYEFSEQVLKTSNQGGGSATVAFGRLQLQRWTVMFDDTGYFRVEVEQPGRKTYTYHYNANMLPYPTLGISKLGSGEFPFRVNGRSDRVKVRVVSDSFLPVYLTAAEWEGRFERKTSRI